MFSIEVLIEFLAAFLLLLLSSWEECCKPLPPEQAFSHSGSSTNVTPGDAVDGRTCDANRISISNDEKKHNCIDTVMKKLRKTLIKVT